jgi:hypothetical protein
MTSESNPPLATLSERTNLEPSAIPRRSVADGQARARAIAEAQGTLGTSTFENHLGSGERLWDSPEDFERFMELVREIRHAKG